MDKSLTDERESLTADIERIKLALQGSVGDDSSDGEQLHSDWEAEQHDTDDGSAYDTGSSHRLPKTLPEKPTDQIDDDLQSEATDVLHLGSESGELPSNLETCLGLNRAYQEVILENIKRIELVLAHNRERQVSVQAELEKQLTDKTVKPKRRHLTVYSKPYFKDVNGMIPPQNEDTKQWKACQIYDGYLKPVSQWTSSEKKTLQESVKADNMQKIMRPVLNRREVEQDKLNGERDDNKIKDLKASIEILDKELMSLRSTTDEAIFYGDRFDCERIDWMKISVVDFNGLKSAINCELAWRNALHPGINTAKWKASEDTALTNLASKYGCTRWETIAEELETNRSGFQCLQRYQTKLNPCLKTGKWTQEELKFLLEVIEGCVENDRIQWNQVAYYMEGRSREQCMAKWNMLNNERRGKWSDKEDMNLIDAVLRFGSKNWGQIKIFVPGREAGQLRERYLKTICPDIKLGDWSYEEDRILWLWSLKEKRGSWKEIAQQLPGRTDNQCIQRWQRLKKWEEQAELLKKLPPQTGPSKESKLIAEVGKQRKIRKKKQQAAMTRIRDETEKAIIRQDLVTPVGNTLTVVKYSVPTETEEFGKSKKINEVILEMAKTAYEKMKVKDDLKEKDAIERDKSQGIIIPRPSESGLSTRVFNNVLQKRADLFKFVRERVQRQVLRENSMPTNISSLSKSLRKKDVDKLNARVKKRIALLDDNPTVRTILQITGGEKLRKKHTGQGRRKIKPVDVQVEQEIAKLLQNRVTRKGKVGRPRKFLAQDTVSGKKPVPGKEMSQDTMIKISKVMLAALNVDIQGAVDTAERERRERLMHPQYDPLTTSQTPSKNPQSTSTLKSNKISSVDGVRDDAVIENDIIILEQATGCKISGDPADNITVCAQKAGEKRPHEGETSASPATSKRRRLSTADTEHSSEDQPLDLSSPKSSHRRHSSVDSHNGRNGSKPRPSLQGPAAAKAYGMPPLPPTCSTLNAFKQLLLCRRDLIKSSSRYTMSEALAASLGVKKKKKKMSKQAAANKANKPSCSQTEEPADRLRRDMANLLDAQNAAACNVQPTKEVVTLSSEDIDPSILPKTTKLSSMIAAQDFLKKNEVQAQKTVTPLNTKPVKPISQQILLSQIRKTHDYQMLKARLVSLFFWPALLSTVEVNETPTKLVETPVTAIPSASTSTAETTVPAPSKKTNKKRHKPGKNTKAKNKATDPDKPKKAPAKKKVRTTLQPVRKSSRLAKPINPEQILVKTEQDPVSTDGLGQTSATAAETGETQGQEDVSGIPTIQTVTEVPHFLGFAATPHQAVAGSSVPVVSTQSTDAAPMNTVPISGISPLIPIDEQTLPMSGAAVTGLPLTVDPSSLQNVVSQVKNLFQQGSLESLIKMGVKLVDPGTMPSLNGPIVAPASAQSVEPISDTNEIDAKK